jgi:uroporphyrinogen III methyltransferase/synthase
VTSSRATVAVPSRPAGSTVVELVGAGPGDPDLLTLRAEAALAAASVVVSDAAVAHLAEAFAPNATISVTTAGGPDPGAGDGGATVDGDVVRIVTGAARRGQRVVRLYQGDPWLHPAYAVESAILASLGIEHVAVPGPTVELAVPTAAGLAVHHRPLAVTVTLAAPGALPPATDPARTLVTIADDAAAVAAALGTGGDPSLPAAVVATGEGAAVVRRGTLAELAADPSIGAGVVVVGAVVGAAPSPVGDSEVGRG